MGRLLLAVFIVAPFIAFAHEEGDQLSAKIRADLLLDPRAQELSHEELDTLVDALSERATEEGIAEEYVQGAETFDFSSEFPQPAPPSLLARVLTPATLVALICLMLILSLVAYYIVRRPHTVREPDSQ